MSQRQLPPPEKPLEVLTRRLRSYIGSLSLALIATGCTDDPTAEEDGQELGTETGDELSDPPHQPSLRQILSPTEYNNTVAALLGYPLDGYAWPDIPELAERVGARPLEANGVFVGAAKPTVPPWPWLFPEEIGVDDFEGMLQGQTASAYQVEELHWASLHFASYAPSAPRFWRCGYRPNISAAATPSPADLDCALRSIESFAQRAYRRAMESDERESLVQFWQANLAVMPMDEAIAITIAGVLQSPGFLFKAEDHPQEPGSSTPLDDWQLASRLAYFLWDSMPDEQLFSAAASGQLADPAGIEREARRMLDDPRARAAVVHFHHQLLGTEGVLRINPARRAFGQVFGVDPDPKTDTTGDEIWPGILVPMRYSLQFETELFIEGVIFRGPGDLTTLLTDHHGYVSKFTAPIYGDSAVPLGGRRVDRSYAAVVASGGSRGRMTLYPAEFPADQRAGILTLPSVLSLGAYAVQPGPILRGLRVLERLACVEFAAPPPGAEASLPPDTLTADSSNRERTTLATSGPACVGCHSQINPAGFAYEHYDAIGRWRAHDNGQPVDASGQLTLHDGTTLSFRNAIDLGHQLATSPQVRDCYSLRWVRYALGDHIAEDTPGLAPLQQQFRMHDSIPELLVAIARSPLFRSHRSGVEQ